MMLEVRDVSKSYTGEYGAVDSVSFELGQGEVLSIVGKSGSGKSTLLQIVAGLMKPDQGEVIFNNERLKDPAEQLISGHNKIKMVFQDFQVKPNMTVYENVKYKLLHFNEAYQKERTTELLSICGLVEYCDKKPHELSGGQQQRLSLARALADDPQLLLMDEPFSNLDPIIKEDLFLEILKIIKNQSISVILVSHDTRDALLFSDKIAFIEEGNIKQIADPEMIYNQPLDLHIAQFFGRVNIIRNAFDQIKYVRSEMVRIGEEENDISIKVESSRFMGNVYLNAGIHENGDKITYYSKSIQKRGEKIIVGFQYNDELQFSLPQNIE